MEGARIGISRRTWLWRAICSHDVARPFGKYRVAFLSDYRHMPCRLQRLMSEPPDTRRTPRFRVFFYRVALLPDCEAGPRSVEGGDGFARLIQRLIYCIPNEISRSFPGHPG